MFRIPRTVLSVVAVLAALSALLGCNALSPTSLSSDCEQNNTASVAFENRSTSSKTYTVIWDGSNLETLAPGVKGEKHTVAAGVQHVLVFRVSNTSQNACSPSMPTPAQCSSTSYWCDN